MINVLFVFKDKSEIVIKLEKHIAELWFTDKATRKAINKFGSIYLKE